MAGLSNYLRTALLDHVVGNTSMASPAAVYVQVHTGDPGAAGTSNLSDVTSRVAATFGSASGRVASNDAAVDFDSVSLTGDETWSGFSIWDAASGGNCLFWGPLSPGVLMQDGDSFSFGIGDIDLTMSGVYTTYLGNALLNHALGTSAFAQPGGVHAAMHTADPTVAGNVSPATETDRIDMGAFDAASAGATANTNAATLSAVSTTEVYTHVVLHDASSGGNPLLFGALTTPKSMTAGDDAEFAAGELDITFA